MRNGTLAYSGCCIQFLSLPLLECRGGISTFGQLRNSKWKQKGMAGHSALASSWLVILWVWAANTMPLFGFFEKGIEMESVAVMVSPWSQDLREIVKWRIARYKNLLVEMLMGNHSEATDWVLGREVRGVHLMMLMACRLPILREQLI